MPYRCLLYLLLAIFAPALLAAPLPTGRPVAARDAAGDAAALQAIDAAKAAGLHLVQIRANWPRLQPKAGLWNFAWLDALVRQANAQGLDIVLVLGPAPAWTVTYLSPEQTDAIARAKPTRATLAACATVLAKRYGQKVKYYQTWERPCGTTLLAATPEVHALFRAVAKAVHGVHPDLRVIMPEPGNVHLGWIADLLAAPDPAARPDILLLDAGPGLTPLQLGWRLQTLRERILPPEGGPALWGSLAVGDTARAAVLAQLGVTTLCYAACAADGEALPVDLAVEQCTPGASFRPAPVAGASVRLDLTGADPAGIHPLSNLPAGAFTRTGYQGRDALSTNRDEAPWIYLDVPDGFLFCNVERVPVEVTVHVAGVTQPRRTGFSLAYDAVGGTNHAAWQWIDTCPADTPTVYAYTFLLQDALFANNEGYDLYIDRGGSRENVTVVDVIITKPSPPAPVEAEPAPHPAPPPPEAAPPPVVPTEAPAPVTPAPALPVAPAPALPAAPTTEPIPAAPATPTTGPAPATPAAEPAAPA